MKKMKSMRRTLMKKYDLAVIGGGFAGTCAALAAAREGAKVIIVEKGNSLGGAAVNSLVNPFMPSTTRIGGVKTELSAGLFKTICDELTKVSAIGPSTEGESFLEEELKFLLNNMVCDAGIDLLYHAYIFKVQRSGEKIESVVLATRAGELTLEADYFIDATGDAQVAFLAGCPTTLGREPDHLCQPMTLCFRLGNVDKEAFYKSKQNLAKAHKEALERGELTNPRHNILVFPTQIPNVLHFNTTRVIKLNPTDPVEVTKAEIIARKQVYEIYNFMKRHADGLENSFLMMTAAEIGVRESRMIVGDFILTEEHCRAFTKFEDSIAACNYDIDIHSPDGGGTSHYYFPIGEYYTIPYRALLPKNAENMLVAGRCLSSDHGAQASYRIMPTVCCIGEAAGAAAALAIKNKTAVKDIDVKHLQNILKENGAFLGI